MSLTITSISDISVSVLCCLRSRVRLGSTGPRDRLTREKNPGLTGFFRPSGFASHPTPFSLEKPVHMISGSTQSKSARSNTHVHFIDTSEGNAPDASTEEAALFDGAKHEISNSNEGKTHIDASQEQMWTPHKFTSALDDCKNGIDLFNLLKIVPEHVDPDHPNKYPTSCYGLTCKLNNPSSLSLKFLITS